MLLECITCGQDISGLIDRPNLVTKHQTLECCSERCLTELKYFIEQTDEIIKEQIGIDPKQV